MSPDDFFNNDALDLHLKDERPKRLSVLSVNQIVPPSSERARLREADSSRIREEIKDDDFKADSTPIVSQIGDLSHEPPFCDISYNFSEKAPSSFQDDENLKLRRKAPLNTSNKLRLMGSLRVEKKRRNMK